MTLFTHLNDQGEAHMVDVGGKAVSHRVALASGLISMQTETLAMLTHSKIAKGDVLAVARVAGIMAAKRTADMIPLCHGIFISHVEITFDFLESPCGIRCQATVETHSATGVEMEALMAVQISLLTIYDMCKAVDRGMVIEQVCLDEKRGGRTGHWQRIKPEQR